MPDLKSELAKIKLAAETNTLDDLKFDDDEEPAPPDVATDTPALPLTEAILFHLKHNGACSIVEIYEGLGCKYEKSRISARVWKLSAMNVLTTIRKDGELNRFHVVDMNYRPLTPIERATRARAFVGKKPKKAAKAKKPAAAKVKTKPAKHHAIVDAGNKPSIQSFVEALTVAEARALWGYLRAMFGGVAK